MVNRQGGSNIATESSWYPDTTLLVGIVPWLGRAGFSYKWLEAETIMS